MNRKNYFQQEQARANDLFFSADGFANDNFYGQGYSGNGFNNDNFYGQGYSSAEGAAPVGPQYQIVKSNPYIFKIVNSAAVDISGVVLLGANQNAQASASNFNNNAAITITQENGSLTYVQFLQSLYSRAILTGRVLLQSSNTSQPFRPYTVAQTDSNGATSSLPYSPTLDPFQQQSGVSFMDQLVPIDSYTTFTFTILASATLYVYLYPAKVLDTSRAVIGMPAVQPFNNPNNVSQPITYNELKRLS